jgi:hypothetical protein
MPKERYRLEPEIKIAYMYNFNNAEQRDIMEIVSKHFEEFKINGMNTSVNNFDSIEKMIFDEGLRIEAVDFHPELDVMLIVLNTKRCYINVYHLTNL